MKQFLCVLMIYFLVGCTPQTQPDLPQTSSIPSPEQTALPLPTPSVLKSFSTPILDKKKARLDNIALAIKPIDGKILKPQEEFSFNKTVGERTAERGFQKAIIFFQGKKVHGEGGGICQISTSLFNVAELAGLKITERHKHTEKVDYIEEGKDATVSYGEADLRFVNTFDFPIQIKVSMTKDKMTATLYKMP
ncbi:MAG: VanW family protein [Hyphomonadaceae bacterium]|nr:VanW family protein [Clostridia bacterium]